MQLMEDYQIVLNRSGAHTVGVRSYGLWNQYPFSAHVDRAKEPGAVTFDFKLGATLEGGVFKTLRKAFPKGLRLVAAGGSGYRLVCSGGPLRRTEQSLSQLLDMFTRSLREAGVAPTDVCPICHATGCDAYADVGGYTSVHRSCVEALAESTKSRAESSLQSGSYVTGFIGALLGGLVACIPTVVVYFLGWMVGYLYALIPLGAYYGYKLFRGRMNRGAFVCTCISSLIHLFSLEQIIFYVMVVQEWNIWPSIFDTIGLYWSFMSVGDVLSDMAMSIVFMGLGLWISWGVIRRNAYTDLGAANTVKDTLSEKAADENQFQSW